MASRTDEILGSLAVERRLVTEAQLAELLRARASDGRSLGELLLVHGYVNAVQIAQMTEQVRCSPHGCKARYLSSSMIPAPARKITSVR